MRVDRYKNHDIEIVIDRLKIDEASETEKRLMETINTAMYHGDDVLMVLDYESGEIQIF